MISDSQNICSLLNDFFASVFTEENLAELPETKRKFFGSTYELCDFYITSDMVETKLKRLKQNKCSLNWLMLSLVISNIVSCLFRKSLSSGDIPDDWKSANVTTIFKKGFKYSPGNYRSVSLTVQLCKVMESLIRNKMVEHLEKHNLISASQHGFLKNKSCLTNLLVFLEEVTNYVDSGYQVDVLYLDFQKAFDRVPINVYC